MYSPQVLDHFEHPRNAGALPSPDVVVRIENPACGDVLELSLKMAGDSIDAIGFLAKGCVASMACASAMTELVRGLPVQEARRVSRGELLAALGGLPPASMHATHLAVDALKAALDRVARK